MTAFSTLRVIGAAHKTSVIWLSEQTNVYSWKIVPTESLPKVKCHCLVNTDGIKLYFNKNKYLMEREITIFITKIL